MRAWFSGRIWLSASSFMSWVLALVLFAALGFALLGPPAGIDSAHRHTQWFGVFFLFILWILALWGWGSSIPVRSKRDGATASRRIFLPLLLGSVVSAYGMSIFALLSHVGIFPLSNGSVRAGLLIFFFGGGTFFFGRAAASPKAGILSSGVRSLTRTERWALLAVGLAWLTRFVFAARLHRHGDALLYHLLGPRTLYDSGGFNGFVENPILFQVSHWESLTQWANLLLAAGPGTGLGWVQIFAQWTHVALGFGGAGLGIFVLLGRAGLSITAGLVVAVTALSPAQLEWTAHLAKTDWGIVFWCIGAIWMLLERQYVWSGFLVGMVFSAKITSTFTLLGLCSAALALRLVPRHPRAILSFLAAALVAAAPIWIRNGGLSGNPFFPTLNEFFKSPLLADSLRAGVNKHSFFHLQSDLVTWIARAHELLTQTRWSGVLLVAPLMGLNWAWRSRGALRSHALRVTFVTVFFTWGTWALFTAKVAADAEMRWLGPALPLALAASGALFFLSLESLSRRRPLEIFSGHEPKFLLVMLIASIVASSPPTFAWVQWGPDRFPLPEYAVLGMRNGPAKKWLRAHAGTDLILATQDNEMYYLAAQRTWVSYFHPAADRVSARAANADAAIRLWRELGVRYYLLDTAGAGIDPHSRSWDTQMTLWVRTHPQALAYGSVGEPLVIDLKSAIQE